MTDRLGTERKPELVEVLRVVIDQAQAQMYVALPAKVETFDPIQQTVSAKPLIKRPFVNQDATEGVDDIPTIPGVPVQFPGGGGYFLSFPLVKGDEVLLVFSDNSIDEFMQSNGQTVVDPADLKMHDVTDAFAIPGGRTIVTAIKDIIAGGLVLGKEKGYQLRIGDGAVEVTSKGLPASVGGYVAMAQKVDAMWTALTVFLDAFVPPVPDGGAALATGMSTALKAVPAYQNSASTNLKAD